jgi:hypothetical protein
MGQPRISIPGTVLNSQQQTNIPSAIEEYYEHTDDKGM